MPRIGLAALVLLAPLAFGAAPAWGWATLAAGVALLLLATVPDAAAGRLHRPPWPFGPAALGLFAGVAALGLWQALAGGPVHPLRVDAAGALDVPVVASPALDPVAVREALVRLAAYGAIVWLAAQAWRGRSSAGLLAAVAGMGAVYAGYGLCAWGLGWDSVLWLGRTAYDGATGPFVARGAFAATCGLAMLCAAGGLPAALRRAASRTGWAPWALAGAWLLAAAGLLASQSRTGLAAALAAHLVLLALIARPEGLSGRRAAALAAGLLLAAGLAAAATGVGGRLLASADDLGQRTAIWSAALAVAAERPLIGHGLGSFAAAFETVRPDAAARPVRTAHSGPLEWAVEAGLPATLAWFAGLGLLGMRVLRPALGPRRMRDPAPAVATAALLLLALHGSIDFAPQVPAVAALGALLLGVGLAHQGASPRA